VCAVEALHKKNIIFRDLKPDNVVLDADGHALLTDFGLSRQQIDKDFSGADSFCGSYAYLAPEMIKKQGHGKAVDWYLIGVVLFELLTGLPPFYDDDKEVLFTNITNNKVEVPKEVKLSKDCLDLLNKLLVKDPRKRLGSVCGIRDIKAHPWFKGVDWKAVASREVKPPSAYLSEMALDIIAKQPFMLKDHPKTQGQMSKIGHPMHVHNWEMNLP
jgi:serine/threonine protein kinase